MRRIMLVLALVVVGVSCGNGDESVGDSGKQPGDSLLDLLGVVPDTPDHRHEVIYYGNLDRLRDGDSPDSLEDDLTLLAQRSSNAVFGPSMLRNVDELPEFEDITGFDYRHVDAFVEFGFIVDQVSVLVGDFDSDQLAAGLAGIPGGEELVVETVDGSTYLSVGEEGVDFNIRQSSPVRRNGEPLRLAVAGNTLYWAPSDVLRDACFAALHDESSSLADDHEYAAIATVLDNGQVVNALIVMPRDGQAWTVGGVGESFQGDTSTLTIALQYPDAARASAAVHALGTMVESGASEFSGVAWSEFLTATDIHSEGALLVATMTSRDPGVIETLIFRQENLLDV